MGSERCCGNSGRTSMPCQDFVILCEMKSHRRAPRKEMARSDIFSEHDKLLCWNRMCGLGLRENKRLFWKFKQDMMMVNINIVIWDVEKWILNMYQWILLRCWMSIVKDWRVRHESKILGNWNDENTIYWEGKDCKRFFWWWRNCGFTFGYVKILVISQISVVLAIHWLWVGCLYVPCVFFISGTHNSQGRGKTAMEEQCDGHI